MIEKFTTLCLAAVLAGTLALAQPTTPGTAPTPPDPTAMITMQVNQLAAQLNLTDAQKTQAITIFTNAYTASQTAQTSTQTNQQALTAAVKANNTASIDSAAFAIGTAQGQLASINGRAQASFRAILTSAQQTLFDAMPQGGPGGRGGMGGMGGRGGMGGPGGMGPQGMRGNGMRGMPPQQ